MEQHEFEFETVTLTDEEGVERDFDILAVMELEGNEYYALVPTDSDEDEYIILKSEPVEGDEQVLITIDDDAEFDRVAEAFDNELMMEYEEEDGAN
ncbi:MAG: DUF1292 domain-containing protein [Clostridia bacterium]|nr:DUF1292 domain-containing protein [Clostridia bacterium]